MDNPSGIKGESLQDVAADTNARLSAIESCLDRLEGVPSALEKEPAAPGLNSTIHSCREQAKRVQERVLALAERLGQL